MALLFYIFTIVACLYFIHTFTRSLYKYDTPNEVNEEKDTKVMMPIIYPILLTVLSFVGGLNFFLLIAFFIALIWVNHSDKYYLKSALSKWV